MDVHPELQRPGQCCVLENQTLEQCKQLCIDTAGCKAIEYGVDYGGGGHYLPGDCQLQSSDHHEGCDGAYYNVDLYTLGGGSFWSTSESSGSSVCADRCSACQAGAGDWGRDLVGGKCTHWCSESPPSEWDGFCGVTGNHEAGTNCTPCSPVSHCSKACRECGYDPDDDEGHDLSDGVCKHYCSVPLTVYATGFCGDGDVHKQGEDCTACS